MIRVVTEEVPEEYENEITREIRDIVSRRVGIPTESLCISLNMVMKAEKIETEITVHYDESEFSDSERENLLEFRNSFSEEEFSNELSEIDVELLEVTLVSDQNIDETTEMSTNTNLAWYEQSWFIVIIICAGFLIVLIPVTLLLKKFVIDRQR